jgi:hypothetical protein
MVFMAVFIQLDRPRQMRFGFNAIAFLRTAHNIETLETLFTSMSKGDLSSVLILVEACLVGDNAGLTTEALGFMLDEFIEKNSMEKLTELLKETINNSMLAKDLNKKKAKK